MSIIDKIKKSKNKDENRPLIINTIYDLIIYSLVFLILFVLIRLALKSMLNLNDMGKEITSYKEAVSYTVDNTIYIAIISVIISIGSFCVFMGTIIDNFKRKLINKDNYRFYIVFMIVSILILTAVAGLLIIGISNSSLLCIGKLCKITDLSFYNYEVAIYERLHLGLVLNYSIWTFIMIIISTYTIKYLHNKKIIIKETEKEGIIKRIIRKKKKNK